MPRPTPTLDTRASLLEAALACFAEYGYNATSLRLIATRAGKNTSLIAYHFRSKEGLYREVIALVLGEVLPSCAEAHPIAPQPEDGRAWLRALIRRTLMDVEAHLRSADPRKDAAARLMLSEFQFPREEVKDLLQSRAEAGVRDMRACLRCLRPDLSDADIDFWGVVAQGISLSHALHGEFNRLIWTQLDPSLTLELMADRLTAFILDGLLKA